MCGYHAQLSMVTSDMDIISVVFIRNKLLKLHASVSIHTTGISLGIPFQSMYYQFGLLLILVNSWTFHFSFTLFHFV